MSMTAEEIDLERARRKDDQRSEALIVASRHLPGTSADEVVAAAEKFHTFLTS